MASTIQWPGEKAGQTEHIKYLQDVARHISESEHPANYHQMPHGEGTTVGDPTKPAMLNASYRYFGRSLVSFSIPEFTNLEKPFVVENGNFIRGNGVNTFNLMDSLSSVLRANGIEPGESKIGHDRLSRTYYIEMDVSDKDYDRSKAIVNEIVNGRDKSPEQIRQNIQKATATPPPKPQVDHKATIGAMDPIHTSKGIYVSVDGLSAEQIAEKKEALKKSGIEFTEKKTSLNGGMNVLAISPQSADKFTTIKAEAQTPQQAPQQKSSASVQSVPANVEPHMKEASARAREQLAEIGKPPTDKSGGSPRSEVGGKVNAGLGHAATAVDAAAHLAKGDTLGAVESVAKHEGANLALKKGVEFFGKRIPGIGAIVTAGMTLWSSGAEAARGNYGKAATELGAGAAEAAGNIVGFGAGDALRETFRAAVTNTVGEKYAPEKSGIRVMAETAIDVGKKVSTDIKYKSMGRDELARAIHKDETLPDTVRIAGKDVALEKALEDKTFRTSYIQNLQSAAEKGHGLQDQIAMIQAFDEKLKGEEKVAASSPSRQGPLAKPSQTTPV